MQEVVHSRFNIKYSPKKMWYIAAMVSVALCVCDV